MQPTYEELSLLLEKQQEECTLAATIGQMLVKENQQVFDINELKDKLAQTNLDQIPVAAEEFHSLSSGPILKNMIDPDLEHEIQRGLLHQIRKLTTNLEEEYNARIEAEKRNAEYQNSLDALQTKTMQMKKKNGSGD